MSNGNQDSTALTRRGSRRFTAFTLFETLAVLAIMLLGIAFVVPRIARVPAGVAVRQGVSTIENAFRSAATHALATGRKVELVLDTEQNRFRIGSGAGAAQDAAASALPLDDFPLPDGMIWDTPAVESAFTYTFHPGGEAGGPTLEFEIRKRRFRLEIDPFTGRPDIRELAAGTCP